MAGSNFRLNFIQFAAVVSSRKSEFSFALWQKFQTVLSPSLILPLSSCLVARATISCAKITRKKNGEELATLFFLPPQRKLIKLDSVIGERV